MPYNGEQTEVQN